MDYDKIKDLSQDLGEEFERTQNAMMRLSMMYLMKNYKTGYYRVNQTAMIPQFNKDLLIMSKKMLKRINESYKKAIVMSLTNEFEIDKKAKTITTTIDEKKLKKLYRQIELNNNILILGLVKSVQNNHLRFINKISNAIDEALIKISPQIEISPKQRTNAVFKAISDNIKTYGAVENVPKVAYSDNRQVSWKSYMEMNARTTLTQEAGDYQLESGKELGVVFYICNEMGDCAKDHIDYQGRIYYDKDYQTFGLDETTLQKIEDAIQSQNMLSIQEVRDSDPWLTTRPNCRHTFLPVTIDEVASSSVNSLLNKHHLKSNGKVDSKKYEALEKQRYNERQIRKWKEKADNDKAIYQNAPKELKQDLKMQLDKDNAKIKEWQLKQKKHIDKNSSFLERQYDRESYKVIMQDLGYRFQNR